MLPDRVSNPGPLTYESGALPIALRGPATRLVVMKFHIYPSGVGETKSCSNGSGHMTNMTVTPKFGKNLKNSSAPDRWPMTLVCRIGYASFAKIFQIMILSKP